MVAKARKTTHQSGPKTGPKTGQTDINSQHADVVVFVEKPEWNATAITHAQRVADALGGHVVVMHVLAPPQEDEGPVDPVDWDIRRQKTRNWLTGVARGCDVSGHETEMQLLEGQPIGQISAHMANRKGDIAAAMRPADQKGWRLSDTVCGVLASDSAAILMIPRTAPPQTAPYRKVLVPLDGSARAKSALHLAAALASAEGAELVLCYVPPQPGLTAFGMIDDEAAQLSSQVHKRNTQAGQMHLTKVKNSLAHLGLNISTLIVPGGDVRRVLIDTVASQGADFMVMATHGQSGHRDVPTGSVASFIFERSEIPVLLVRSEMHPNHRHATNHLASNGVRQPVGTDQ